MHNEGYGWRDVVGEQDGDAGDSALASQAVRRTAATCVVAAHSCCGGTYSKSDEGVYGVYSIEVKAIEIQSTI